MKSLALAKYGMLGLPLAMAALPVYVQIPTYYTTHLGAGIAATGFVIFAARLIDTIQDPWLGKIIDQRNINPIFWFSLFSLLLAGAFLGLWLPPQFVQHTSTSLLAWLAGMLVIAYTAHSALNIAYLSWGSRLDTDTQIKENKQLPAQPSEKITHNNLLNAAAWREGFGLAGVILASVIPTFIFLQDEKNFTAGLVMYGVTFSILLLVGVFCLFGSSAPMTFGLKKLAINESIFKVLDNKNYRRFLPIYFLNSLSVSIPATLILFFINDRIGAPNQVGLFLSAYFIAGAVGLPFWIMFAKRTSTKTAWQTGMLLAVTCFIGASFLGHGDSQYFLVICIGSGLALGADLALPPVFLTEIISKDEAIASFFGGFSLIGKLTLALSGLSLPLLSYFMYQPGVIAQSSAAFGLTFIYGVVPCFLKICAFIKLSRYST